MKNLISLTVAIIILGITSCINGQYWKTVSGHGNVVTKERKTDSFTGLKVSSGIDVYLKQGNDESVSVEADENLHEYIITEVRNGVLNVYSEYNIRDAEKKRVYVTMKEVNSIKTTSAGDADVNVSERLTARSSSAGDINYKGDPKYIDAHSSSAGGVHRR